MKAVIAVISWLALSLFAGIAASAVGAGSLAWPWLAAPTGFMALLFSPLLAPCGESGW